MVLDDEGVVLELEVDEVLKLVLLDGEAIEGERVVIDREGVREGDGDEVVAGVGLAVEGFLVEDDLVGVEVHVLEGDDELGVGGDGVIAAESELAE